MRVYEIRWIYVPHIKNIRSGNDEVIAEDEDSAVTLWYQKLYKKSPETWRDYRITSIEFLGME